MIRRLKNSVHKINAYLACMYYGFPGKKLTTIGITGTDGKTTTTHLVYEILKKARYKVSMLSTVYAIIGGEELDTGFHTTTPDPWFLQKMLKKAVDAGDTHMVIEVTSHALDQNRVFGIPFAIGVLTNISHEHLDYHGTADHYARTKFKLLQRADVAILNKDDESYKTFNELRITAKKIITYGTHDADVVWTSELPKNENLPGDHNAHNILAAGSVANVLGVDDTVVKKAIKDFNGIPGRYQKVTTRYGFSYVIDFAHTPNAFKQLLATVRAETKGRIIHVFGCTGMRDRDKRPIMGKISADMADVTILTEDDTRTENIEDIINQIKSGIKRTKNVFVYNFRQDAINFATSIARPGDVIVLAGKGHEKTILRGTTEYPWSEQNAIKKALDERSKQS